LNTLGLSKINDQVYRVLDTQCNHVGNLKSIGGVWKFKAIGYDASGQVIPRGGPLTHLHNTTFATLNEEEISTRLSTVCSTRTH
jgi:hypothetical protein